jgi:opacity protein-like surface antigen
LIHNPDYAAPFYIIISEKSVINEVSKKIEAKAKTHSSSYLIINGTNSKTETIKDSINNILNGELHITKTKVYLIIIGSCEFFNAHDKLTNDFFPSKYFVQTDSINCNYNDYNHQYYNDLDFDKIFNALIEKYLWGSDLDEIQTNHHLDYRSSSVEYGFGLGLSLNKPIGLRNENHLPGSFISYDIYGYRRLSEGWRIYGNLSFGLKKPNIKKIIRDEVLSQGIDISSWQSGDDVTVDLDTEVEGRLFFSGSIEGRKFIKTKHKIKPFGGVGISYTYFMNTLAHIDTSLVLNSSMVNGGADFRDSFDFDQSNSNLDQSRFNHFGMILSAGFEYPLSDNTMFNLKTTYNLSSNSFNTNVATLNNFNCHLGLSFRLRGKSHSYYNYIRLK